MQFSASYHFSEYLMACNGLRCIKINQGIQVTSTSLFHLLTEKRLVCDKCGA